RSLTDQAEPVEGMAERHRDLLLAYAGAHLRATSLGRELPWSVEVTDATGHPSDDGPRVRFRFVLRAPRGEASSSVRLDDDLVAHEVVSHHTAVYVRSDWATG